MHVIKMRISNTFVHDVFALLMIIFTSSFSVSDASDGDGRLSTATMTLALDERPFEIGKRPFSLGSYILC